MCVGVYVCVCMYVCVCVCVCVCTCIMCTKIYSELSMNLIYLEFVAMGFFLKIISANTLVTQCTVSLLLYFLPYLLVHIFYHTHQVFSNASSSKTPYLII